LEIAQSVALSDSGWVESPDDAPSLAELHAFAERIKLGESGPFRQDAIDHLLSQKNMPWSAKDIRQTMAFAATLLLMPIALILAWLFLRTQG